jgi:hypothetical protein
MRKIFVFVSLFLLMAFANAQTPSITSFAPISGKPGSLITINGLNFSNVDTNNIVYFGTVKARILSASTTSIIAVVPIGATYSAITIFNNLTNLLAVSNSKFTPSFYGSTNTIDSTTFIIQSRWDSLNLAPNIVKLGDINGDNKLDIVILSGDGSTISVLINNGKTGTVNFDHKVDVFLGNNIATFSLADLNNDGKIDIALTNPFSNTISILINATISSGSIIFLAKKDYNTGQMPTNLSISDMNNDGKLDIVVINKSDNTFSVFRNTSTTGNLSFANKTDINNSNGQLNIEVSDFDGDLKNDVVIVNNGNNTITLFKNTSTGNTISFASKVTIPTPFGIMGICVGDFDLDGKQDFVSVVPASKMIIVYRNTTINGILSFSNKIVDNNVIINGNVIVAGDLNGDGITDLIFSSNNNLIYAYQNKSSAGNLVFSSKTSIVSSSLQYDLAVADVDFDGRTDLIASINNYYTPVEITSNTSQNNQIFKIDGQIISTKNYEIKNVNISINSTFRRDSTISTLNGKFTFIDLLCNDYTLRPTKNNDITKANGVTSVDALLTQRHILNVTKLNSPYKIIAADVNGDKAINSVDVLRIKRLILGTDTTFTSSTKGNRLWEFVDSAYVFPDTTNPFPFKDSISFTNLTSNKINQTFIGVKLGDVNYDWNSAVARGASIDNVELIIDKSQWTIYNGQLKIPIKVKNFKEIAAMQYTLHFDNTKYEFVNLEGFKNLQGFEYNAAQANVTGNIAMLWTDKNAEAKTLEDGTELFVLILRSTVDRQQSTDLALTIDNSITDIEAWDKDFNQHNIVLVPRTINDKPQTINEILIYPNPANNIVTIDCKNAKRIVIVDATGRNVYDKNVINCQSSIINVKQFIKGIYIVQASLKDGNIINQKLIVE